MGLMRTTLQLFGLHHSASIIDLLQFFFFCLCLSLQGVDFDLNYGNLWLENEKKKKKKKEKCHEIFAIECVIGAIIITHNINVNYPEDWMRSHERSVRPTATPIIQCYFSANELIDTLKMEKIRVMHMKHNAKKWRCARARQWKHR